MTQVCYCGASTAFEQCCQPLHQLHIDALTPEQLMRSRYSAFVTGDAQYLFDTHHSEYRSGLNVTELAQACKQSKFVGLEIVDAPPSSTSSGEVEFKAWYQQGKEVLALWERSQFSKIDGLWKYCRGEIKPTIKLGRNDPCPCGCGLKAKKCLLG